jgi:hypothetical protein
MPAINNPALPRKLFVELKAIFCRKTLTILLFNAASRFCPSLVAAGNLAYVYIIYFVL